MLFRWCHFSATISIIFYLILKQYQMHNLAQFFLVIVGLLFSLLPVMRGIYIFQEYHLYKNFCAPLHTWIYIELSFFTIWILSLALFVLLAYLNKYKSIFKKSSDESMQKAIDTERKMVVKR